MLKTQLSFTHLGDIDSTQTYAKKHTARLDDSVLYCIYADSQSDGIGTHGRSWHSPKGENLYLTFVFSYPRIQSLYQIAQVLSYSAAKVLKNLNLNPFIKWPNDIMLSHKKVAGVLCEYFEEYDTVKVFAGIGMNLNMRSTDMEKIPQAATSLYLETQNHYSLNLILTVLSTEFLNDLNLYIESGFSPFFEEYSQLMIYKNAPVLVNNQLIGYMHQMHIDGSLIITNLNGSLEKIYSGSLDIRSQLKNSMLKDPV